MADFPIPYNACIAQHDQPMVVAGGVALAQASVWANSARTFIIAVTNTGNVAGTFGISVVCQNLSGPVNFSISDPVRFLTIF